MTRRTHLVRVQSCKGATVSRHHRTAQSTILQIEVRTHTCFDSRVPKTLVTSRQSSTGQSYDGAPTGRSMPALAPLRHCAATGLEADPPTTLIRRQTCGKGKRRGAPDSQTCHNATRHRKARAEFVTDCQASKPRNAPKCARTTPKPQILPSGAL